jgi:hypothetical protein
MPRDRKICQVAGITSIRVEALPWLRAELSGKPKFDRFDLVASARSRSKHSSLGTCTRRQQGDYENEGEGEGR